MLSFKGEIITIIGIIVGIKLIMGLGPDPQTVADISPSAFSATPQQHAAWKKRYPSGYKIFAVKGEKIITTEQDTLPDDLKIDWPHVRVSVIPANRLTQTQEKIKITVPITSYAPLSVYDLRVSAVLSRQQRKAVGLTKLGWHNLMIEVIGQDSDSLLCLLGFQ